MALIKCPECGREVSDTAVACPGCGYPIAAGAVGSGEKTPEPSRLIKPTNMGAGGGDPAPDKSDLFKIHRPDLAKIHKRDSHRDRGQSIKATHPARADHWDDGGINDGVWPEDVVLSLDGDLVVGWKPFCGHQFPMPIKLWINNPGCPKCGKRFEDPKPGVIATVAVTREQERANRREQKRANRRKALEQQALKYQPSWRPVPQVVCPHCQHRGSVQQLMPPAEADLDRAVRGALANAFGYGESARRRSMGEAAYAAEKLKTSLTEINMKCSKCSMQWHA